MPRALSEVQLLFDFFLPSEASLEQSTIRGYTRKVELKGAPVSSLHNLLQLILFWRKHVNDLRCAPPYRPAGAERRFQEWLDIRWVLKL
jgi:hypothetical protein